MVSTRRTAHTAPEQDVSMEPDLSMTLRKKAVRRWTAKATTEKTGTKSRATRSRAVEVEAGKDLDGQTDEVCQESSENAARVDVPKPGKRAVGRPRKNAQESPKDEVANNSAVTKSKVTAGRTGIAKAKQAEIPALKATAAARPTRQTRATAAKAQPLSPKKVTQVSKAATRATKASEQKKQPAKADQAKAASVRTRGMKRTESNENEGFVDLATEPDELPGALELPAEILETLRSPVRRETERNDSVESEASMSSRPTTPSDSPAPRFEQPKDYTEDDHDAALVHEESGEDEQADEASDSGSEDELCGPKTPMKRASPRTEAHYLSSVQKTIRRTGGDTPQQTPERRCQRATPRTQKPYMRPAVLASAHRAMTVARGTERALVFRELRQDVAESSIHEPASEAEREDSVADISLSEQSEQSAGDDTLLPLKKMLLSGPAVPEEPLANDDQDDTDPAPESHAGSAVPGADPDETILVADDKDATVTSCPIAPLAPSFDSDDTILINHDDAPELEDTIVSEASDVSDDDLQAFGEDAPAPETIPWQNIREDVTIPIDFDVHLAGVRSMLPVETTERLDVVRPAWDESQTLVGADEPSDMASDTGEVNQTVAAVAEQTVDLNNFLDMAALSEPTQRFQVPEDASVADKPVQHDDKEEAVTVSTDTMPAEEAMAETDSYAKASMARHSMAQPIKATPSGVTIDGDAVTGAADDSVPHYALHTLAFDARRKSLPALSRNTPVKGGLRPNTSDGHSMPRVAVPFGEPWWIRSRRESLAAMPRETPSRRQQGDGQSADRAGDTDLATIPTANTPQERFPRLAVRQNYEEHAKTAAAPSRFRTPLKSPLKQPATLQKPARFPGLSRPTLQEPGTPQNAAAEETREATPKERYPRRATRLAEKLDKTPNERYPRLNAQLNGDAHAKTAVVPSRFRTPTQISVKRPATVQKPGSLRKIALQKLTTPGASHTPMKTPLKPPATSPVQAPMTPHPAAPLGGVVAMVEIYTLDGASASASFVGLLHRLGAKTTKTWNDRITHVIFKDGSPTTLQRVRLHNKEVDNDGTNAHIHCVNSRWVTDCDTDGSRVDESDEAYAVDLAEIPRGGRRRRKSMEPSTLVNLSGNIVRDRKSSLGRSSLGRSSLGRSPLKFNSPAQQPEMAVDDTPNALSDDKENSGDHPSSPATPAYISAPDKLVQQTAPMTRIRKLELEGKDMATNRRLTFWNGGA